MARQSNAKTSSTTRKSSNRSECGRECSKTVKGARTSRTNKTTKSCN